MTFLITLYMLLSSCQEERSTPPLKDVIHSEVVSSKVEEKKIVNNEKIELLDTIRNVFVSNVYGLKFYLTPDTTTYLNLPIGKTNYLDKYDKVFSLKEYKGWYAIKKSIRYKEMIDSITHYKTIDWVYLQKKDIGIVGQDKLSEDNLSLVSGYSTNTYQLHNGRSNPINIDSLLSMKIISASEFNGLPIIPHSFISKKSINYRKKDKLILPLSDSDKVIEFKDFPSTEGGCADTFYEYHGTINILNSYLIGTMSCDVYEYTLVDKNTGKDKHTFEGFPFISSTGKHLISVATIGYNYDTRLTICKIEDKIIKEYTTFYFFSWVVNEQNIQIKWIDENTFVVKAVHPLYLWRDQEEKFAQYIKVKILR